MVGGRALGAGVVVLSTATAALLGAGVGAGAAQPTTDLGQEFDGWASTDLAGTPVPLDGATGPVSTTSDPQDAAAPLGISSSSPDPGLAALGFESGSLDGIGALSVVSAPTESASGEPTVGGAPATAHGAADSEALGASAAPTPPNGAEPAAAGSPGAVVLSGGAERAESSTAPPPATDAPTIPDLLRSVVGVTDPRPVAHGLSPDTTESGSLIAFLAIVVSLFVVAHQLLDRRGSGRKPTRVEEGIVQFR